MVSIDVVIINWNSGERLKRCVESVISSDGGSFSVGKIVVVDNASTDESLSGISGIDGLLEVVKNKRNEGFAKACNIGARLGSADYILFLNPDVVLLPGTLSSVADVLQRLDEDTAVLGIQLVDETGVPTVTCARKPNFAHLLYRALLLDRVFPGIFRSYHLTEFNHSEDRYVEHVSGAFYLIKRHVFDSVGGFDERFFVYLEDLDLSIRVSDTGYRIFFYAGARAYHEGGGTSKSDISSRQYHAVTSRILFVYKHFGRFYGSLILAVALTVEPCIRCLAGVFTLSWGKVLSNVKSYLKLWRNVVKILERAR